MQWPQFVYRHPLPTAEPQAIGGADRPLCATVAALASSFRGEQLLGTARKLTREQAEGCLLAALAQVGVPKDRAELWCRGIAGTTLGEAYNAWKMLPRTLAGLTPSQYQVEAALALPMGGGLLGMGVGLGKTLTSLCAAVLSTKIVGCANRSRLWIVCPLNAMGAWRRYEAEMRTYFDDVRVLSIDSAHKAVGADRALGGVLIIDECFPASALVDTDQGLIPIGRIVNERLSVRVRTASGAFAPVTGTVKKARTTDMVEIIHSGGTLVCTSNHPVWTEEDGYVEAKALSPHHHVRVLRDTVRAMVPGVAHPTVLLRSVLQEGGEKPRQRGAHASCQSYVDAGDQAESAAHPQGPGLRAVLNGARGERESGTDRGAVPPRVPGVAVGGYSDSAPCSPCRIGATEASQSGLCDARSEARGRVGRPHPQQSHGARPGSAERSRVITARVVSAADQEYRDARLVAAGAAQDPHVYCLNVAGHGNFYADGVLVHNCHMAGHGTARRTKALFEIRAGFDQCIGLTGTLLHAGVEPALTQLDLVLPGAAGFATRWRAGEHFQCLVKKQLGPKAVTALARPTGAAHDEFLRLMRTYSVMLTKHHPMVQAEAHIPDQDLLTVEVGQRDGSLDQCIVRLALANVDPVTNQLPHASAVMHLALAEGADVKVGDVMDQLDGTPVVLLAEYHTTLRLVEAALAERKIPFAYVDGAVTGEARIEQVRAFQAGEVDVFVGQVDAAGASIDLFRASVSVCIDHTTRAANYAQALGRTCRRGQQYRCTHIDYVANPVQALCLKRLRAAEDFHMSLVQCNKILDSIRR